MCIDHREVCHHDRKVLCDELCNMRKGTNGGGRRRKEGYFIFGGSDLKTDMELEHKHTHTPPPHTHTPAHTHTHTQILQCLPHQQYTTLRMVQYRWILCPCAVRQVEVIKKAYMQGEVEVQEPDEEEGGEEEHSASPRNVGHNIYILAHQVSRRGNRHEQPHPPVSTPTCPGDWVVTSELSPSPPASSAPEHPRLVHFLMQRHAMLQLCILLSVHTDDL